MKCELLQYTHTPEKVVAAAAKLCYSQSTIDSLMENLTPEKVDAFVKRLESYGHESPFEHVSFTFGIEGVSRALTHQLVRHRLASYSQQSQRYCAADGFEYVIPQSISDNAQAVNDFVAFMGDAQKLYERLTAAGIPKEDARFVLPNAAETKIVVTMNARTLFNFFHHRCCSRAQWEIRAVAFEMLRLVKSVAPNIFRHAGPSCVKGFCPEGNMCCGKAPTIDELIKEYKKGAV